MVTTTRAPGPVPGTAGSAVVAWRAIAISASARRIPGVRGSPWPVSGSGHGADKACSAALSIASEAGSSSIRASNIPARVLRNVVSSRRS